MSPRVDPGDSTASLLVRYFGGEATYWTLLSPRHEALLEVLGSVGHGVIVETALPVEDLRDGADGIATGALGSWTFGPRWRGCNIVIKRDVRPEEITEIEVLD